MKNNSPQKQAAISWIILMIGILLAVIGAMTAKEYRVNLCLLIGAMVVIGGIVYHLTMMKCPYCGEIDSKVIDSRPADDGERIRRRRECLVCQKRFTTYEIVETVPLMVVKKDKSREAFNRQKLLNGMMRACEKRPVSYQMLEDAVDNIEQALLNSYEREITSIHVGELAMQELKNIDEVAYVRFASVYRQFGDINTSMDELKDLLNKRATQGRDTASEDAEK